MRDNTRLLLLVTAGCLHVTDKMKKLIFIFLRFHYGKKLMDCRSKMREPGYNG